MLNKNGRQEQVNHPEKQELSREEAMAYLGVSDTTLDNYVRRGFLKSHKRPIGRKRVFFYLKDLDKLKTLEVKA